MNLLLEVRLAPAQNHYRLLTLVLVEQVYPHLHVVQALRLYTQITTYLTGRTRKCSRSRPSGTLGSGS
jgi:hypothetical protein